ncbi:MAG: hypothetical protein Q4A72_00970 [Bacillota bacterium]|nr:hypothetical protein [Bacillota bacterium]
MYKIIEIADLLGVSKVTVYKKIEQLKPEIIAHMKTEDGITLVSDFGVNLIKNAIKRKKTRKPRDKALLKVVDLNCELSESLERRKRLEQAVQEAESRHKEDLIINLRHLNTMINIKSVELNYVLESNKQLRLALEQANRLLLRLEQRR